jgi:hypothetical protein
MVENKPQKRILVYPNTWILIDADRDENEAKAKWLAKFNKGNKPLDEHQKRRELNSIREGKVIQMKRMKFKR